MFKRILAAVFLMLVLPDIADFPVLGQSVATSMKDYMTDPGVQAVYHECSANGWPIVARLGNLRNPPPQPSQSILYLFVKNQTVDIHAEYFRTPQGHYVLLIAFPVSVVDKALADFIRK